MSSRFPTVTPRRRWPWFVLAAALAPIALLIGAILWSDAPPHDGPGPDAWTGPGEPTRGAEVFESCASCHLANAEGRSDGSIPRLAGQDRAIVARKLIAISQGKTTLPVMTAFARALSLEEIDAVARYLASLPAPQTIGHGDGSALDLGASVYAQHCAACHGPEALGSGPMGAPRLCGQHAGYLLRRMDDARDDRNPGMAAIVATLNPAEKAAVADYLSREPCQTPEAP